ncbi:MAG TPA: hypothetical protein VFN54_06640 [Acidimicrobiales bacterium]|nr:hypothetical protein [Acidimicrobiales bacterium]
MRSATLRGLSQRSSKWLAVGAMIGVLRVLERRGQKLSRRAR